MARAYWKLVLQFFTCLGIIEQRPVYWDVTVISNIVQLQVGCWRSGTPSCLDELEQVRGQLLLFRQELSWFLELSCFHP